MSKEDTCPECGGLGIVSNEVDRTEPCICVVERKAWDAADNYIDSLADNN